MDLNAIYTELILEHSRHSCNKGHLDCANCVERGYNPSCGDDINWNFILVMVYRVCSIYRYRLAISQASTSIAIDLVKGKSEEAVKLADTFLGMIKSEIHDEEKLEVLEDAVAFKNIANMPARVKCAVLAWRTLMEAVKKAQISEIGMVENG